MGFFDSVSDSLGSSLGGLGGSFLGKSMDYDVARKLQHDAQDWQEEFYGKRHQLAVADLKAAGLNPILSAQYGGGSASSPVASVGKMDNPAIVSASIAKTRADIKESQARRRLVVEQTASAKAAAELAKVQAARKGREFSAMDESEYGKKLMPFVEGLPSVLRGPARLGISGAGAVSDLVKRGYQRYKDLKSRPPGRSLGGAPRRLDKKSGLMLDGDEIYLGKKDGVPLTLKSRDKKYKENELVERIMKNLEKVEKGYKFIPYKDKYGGIQFRKVRK